MLWLLNVCLILIRTPALQEGKKITNCKWVTSWVDQCVGRGGFFARSDCWVNWECACGWQTPLDALLCWLQHPPAMREHAGLLPAMPAAHLFVSLRIGDEEQYHGYSLYSEWGLSLWVFKSPFAFGFLASEVDLLLLMLVVGFVFVFFFLVCKMGWTSYTHSKIQ